MKAKIDLDQIRAYFDKKLSQQGPTPGGVDWNSTYSQEVRFEQLTRLLPQEGRFSINDYGCGYGALYDYLAARYSTFQYAGYDLLESMVSQARARYAGTTNCAFRDREEELEVADYTVASGIFNKRFSIPDEDWLEYVLHTIDRMNALSKKGVAFNMLTRYSDQEFMKPDLYYADPLFMFDHCKKNYARNIALLHDYEIYDFTILIRK